MRRPVRRRRPRLRWRSVGARRGRRGPGQGAHALAQHSAGCFLSCPWQFSRNAAEGDHACQRAHRVSPSAETYQEDPITLTVKADQGGIAIDDVCSYAEAGCHAGKVVNLSRPLDLDLGAIRRGAKPWVIEGDL